MNAESKIKAASLSGAMAKAFAEIEAATKSANNPHFKSRYADLGAVIDAVKPPLIKHGLFFTQRCHPCEGGVSVETVLHHEGGEDLSLGTLFVPANKNDAQGFGSALTYARRYGLLTAFGVPTEDDDGNAAVKSAPREQQRGQQSVTEQQLHELQDIANRVGADLQRFCNYFGVESLKAVPAERFEEAKRALNAKKKEPANA